LRKMLGIKRLMSW